jgi:hypothetical protein
MATTGLSAHGAGSGKPLERAQAVWQAAVRLAPGDPDDATVAVLALLRASDFDPSTLRHALTLGRTRLRLRPDDVRLCGGKHLLERATHWLGARGPDGEVGTARSGGAHPGPGALARAYHVRPVGPTGPIDATGMTP